jgi:hypothetical protein
LYCRVFDCLLFRVRSTCFCFSGSPINSFTCSMLLHEHNSLGSSPLPTLAKSTHAEEDLPLFVSRILHLKDMITSIWNQIPTHWNATLQVILSTLWTFTPIWHGQQLYIMSRRKKCRSIFVSLLIQVVKNLEFWENILVREVLQVVSFCTRCVNRSSFIN